MKKMNLKLILKYACGKMYAFIYAAMEIEFTSPTPTPTPTPLPQITPAEPSESYHSLCIKSHIGQS